MAARFLRLRIAYLAVPFQRGLKRIVRSLLFALIITLLAAVFVASPSILWSGDSNITKLTLLLSSLFILAVTLVPVLLALPALEPRQFSPYAMSERHITLGLLLSTLLTWPSLLLIIVLIGQVWLLEPSLQHWWAAVATMATTVIIVLALYRLSTAAFRLFIPQTWWGLSKGIGLVALLTVLPVFVGIIVQAVTQPQHELITIITSVMSFLPFGSPMSGFVSLLRNDETGAAIGYGVTVAWMIILGLLWFIVVRKSLTSIPKSEPANISVSFSDSVNNIPARPAAVIAQRSITYWRRDSRYRVALLAVPLAPLVMLLALYLVGVPAIFLVLLPIPIVLLLLGWSIHNDVAHDSTAIWLHIASATKGTDDRLGRLAPLLLVGIPILSIGAGISVAIIGDWRILPTVVTLNAAILLIAAAVSSVFSVLLPYPTSRPGDTPFSQPSTFGSGAGLVQTASITVTLLILTPVVVISGWAISEPSFVLTMVSSMVNAVAGVGMLWLGVKLGGYLFEKNGPELVALTQSFD